MKLKLPSIVSGSRARQPDARRTSKTPEPPADTALQARSFVNAPDAKDLGSAPQNKNILQRPPARGTAKGTPATTAAVTPQQAGAAAQVPLRRSRPYKRPEGPLYPTARAAALALSNPVGGPAVAAPGDMDITLAGPSRPPEVRVAIPYHPAVQAVQENLEQLRKQVKELADDPQLPEAARESVMRALGRIDSEEALLAHWEELVDLLNQVARLPDAAGGSASKLKSAAKPMRVAMVLGAIGTLIKTIAWYGHTAIPDRALVSQSFIDSDPARAEMVLTAVKIAGSWVIAFAEYIPMTMANRKAAMAGSLLQFRGALEFMDMSWFVFFQKFVKHENLQWQHYTGLLTTTAGCLLMHKSDKVLQKADEMFEGAVAGTRKQVSDIIRLGMEKVRSRQDAAANVPAVSPEQLETFQSRIAEAVSSLGRNGTIGRQLTALAEEIKAVLPSDKGKEKGKPLMLANSPAMTDEAAVETFQRRLESINQMTEALPAMAADLRTASKALKAVASQGPSALKILFVAGFAGLQALLVAMATLASRRGDANSAATLLTAISTGCKNIAWYGPHSISEDWLRDDEMKRNTALIFIGWFTALTEYIPLVMSHRIAHDLSKLRGQTLAMDLAWTCAFMVAMRGEKLSWNHLLGIALACGGVALASSVVDHG
jgi:uncharacterized protein (DUF486 family)